MYEGVDIVADTQEEDDDDDEPADGDKKVKVKPITLVVYESLIIQYPRKIYFMRSLHFYFNNIFTYASNS